MLYWKGEILIRENIIAVLGNSARHRIYFGNPTSKWNNSTKEKNCNKKEKDGAYMKKILKCTFRDLIILICILIFSAFVLMAAVGDALDGSARITQNDRTSNAEIYSQQL